MLMNASRPQFIGSLEEQNLKQMNSYFIFNPAVF